MHTYIIACAVVVAILLVAEIGATSVSIFDFKSLPSCKKDFIMRDIANVSLKSRSKLDCAKSCSLDGRCLGFNLCETGSPASPVPFLCQLVSQWSQNSCGLLSPAPGCIFRQMDLPCVHGSVTRASGLCTCLPGYTGAACDRLYKDCIEWDQGGRPGDSVHVTIQPLGSPTPVVTRCAENKTTLVLRQSHCSSSDAFKTYNWQSLKNASGDCSGCCFIGLDNMYHLLNQGVSYKLNVYMNYLLGTVHASVISLSIQMTNDTGRYALTIGNTVYKSDLLVGEFLPGRQWLFCSLDYDCSGCAASAGHAGWFSGSAPSCEKMEGFNHPVQWLFNGFPVSMNFWVMELEPQ